jgi:hypothetical protein
MRRGGSGGWKITGLASSRSRKRQKGLAPQELLREPSTDSDATDDEEDTLFRETVGYSVLESAVNAIMELWNGNPHVVLCGKELGGL